MTGIQIGVAGLHMAGGTGSGGGPGVPSPPPLTLSLAPNPCVGVMGNTGVPGAEGSGLIEHCIATPAGGTAPYSYYWTQVSGLPQELYWGFTDPTVREVWWSFNGPDHKEAVYRCSVTDGLGVVVTQDVTIIAN